MPERTAARERVESNGSSRNSDASSTLRAGVSDDEMRDHFKDKIEAARNEGAAGAALACLDIFDGDVQLTGASRPPVPRINTTAEFQENALRLFSTLDANSNGYLSLDELGNSVENQQVTGVDAQVAAALFDPTVRANLINISDDQTFGESEVSLADIQGMNNPERDQQIDRADRMVNSFTQNFARLDADNDGYVNDTELNAAINSERFCISDQFRETLTQARDMYDQLRASSRDEIFGGNWGITREDLTAYLATFDDMRRNRQAGADALYRAQATQESVSAQTSDELFAGGPERAITPDAIRQQRIADCYFLASVASIAQSNPEIIRNMIRDNGNRTYTVTFPGDREHPVTVPAPTEAEMGLGNRGGSYGRWASVVERAFGQWRLERGNAGIPGEHSVYPAEIALEAAHGSGDPRYAFRVLTGRDSTETTISSTTDEQLIAQLESALANPKRRQAVTANVPNESPDGFPTGHVYSILGVERRGNNDVYVRIRNPWGEGEGTRRGTITVPLAEFRRNFRSMQIMNAQ